MFQITIEGNLEPMSGHLHVACKNVPDTNTFASQLTEVAKAIARPFVEAGNISLSNIHTTGPKLKENEQTKSTREANAKYRAPFERLETGQSLDGK